jgi:hypothetical protein
VRAAAHAVSRRRLRFAGRFMGRFTIRSTLRFAFGLCGALAACGGGGGGNRHRQHRRRDANGPHAAQQWPPRHRRIRRRLRLRLLEQRSSALVLPLRSERHLHGHGPAARAAGHESAAMRPVVLPWHGSRNSYDCGRNFISQHI